LHKNTELHKVTNVFLLSNHSINEMAESFKGVLDPNFRPFSFELKKIKLFKISFELGFKVL